MAKTRKLQFKGDFPNLVDGQFYTYIELSKAIGATYNCIKNRLYDKTHVVPEDLYAPNSKRSGRKQPNKRKPEDMLRLETESMVLMDSYLRKKL